jgi:hypothetical protein
MNIALTVVSLGECLIGIDLKEYSHGPLRYYPKIFLEGMGKNQKKYVGQDS